METIDILCVVDTNFLMKQVNEGKLSAGTLNSPTSLGSWNDSDSYIFMICDGQYASTKNGTSELAVNASVGNTIRWTITDPSTGLQDNQTQSYCSILYNFSSGTGYGGIITQPEMSSVPAALYYNSESEVTQPTLSAYMCSAWASSVLNIGNVQYNWSFQIVDSATGATVGYFTWDPFINIS
ncbi:AidA/PixA family protein [Reichenbachiella versicolor]|uniref:AidA/PixA family protein n=1 Tax=Reichenbachiella versicolor TaxID=1821036 RepID=UPI000D6E1244|nr:AidA/PixA family protein [Reichenbachiella versicolor]